MPNGFRWRGVDGRDKRCGWRAFAMHLGMTTHAFIRFACRRAAESDIVSSSVLSRWDQVLVATNLRPLDIEDIWLLTHVLSNELPLGVLVDQQTHDSWLHVQRTDRIFDPDFVNRKQRTVQSCGFGSSAPLARVPTIPQEQALSIAASNRMLILGHRKRFD